MELICPHCEMAFVEKLAYELKDGMWKGRAAFVLGGGPSLGEQDRLLEIEQYGLVVATNRALELDLTVDLWCWMEQNVFEWTKAGQFGPEAQRRFLNYDGIYVARKNLSKSIEYPHYVTRVKYEPNAFLGESFDTYINSHSNVGFFGMNLAYCLGADPIVLLGFDQKGTDEGWNKWWHEGYPKKPQRTDRTYGVMQKGFENAAVTAKQARRRIWLVGESTLRCFVKFDSLSAVFDALTLEAGQLAHTSMEG